MRVLVLPGAHDPPACRRKRLVYCPIALYVAGEFGRPVVGIGTRRVAVLRAAVPKAPVDEDCQAGAGEDDIRTHKSLRRADRIVDAVAEARVMEHAAQRHLGASVTPAVATHPVADLGVGGMGVRQ